MSTRSTNTFYKPFFGVFLEFPILSLTSKSRFSNSCFFSAICSSLDFPVTFLSTKKIGLFIRTLDKNFIIIWSDQIYFKKIPW